MTSSMAWRRASRVSATRDRKATAFASADQMIDTRSATCTDVIFPALALHKFKRQQLETQIAAIGQQLEDAQTELRYVQWARQQDVEKVPR